MTFWGEVVLWLRQLRKESERKGRTHLKQHEMFRCALFGAAPAGVALPTLRLTGWTEVIFAFPEFSWWVVIFAAVLVFYVVGIAVLISWRGRSFSPVRTFLSGLLLACFTWTIIELTFVRAVSGG